MSKSLKALIAVSAITAAMLMAFISLRILGLLRPFSVPSRAMAPTISAGDNVMMEGFTYLGRRPQRGDIAVFKTNGIPELRAPNSIWLKRIIGVPGDRIQLSDRKLFVNDREVFIENKAGPIQYHRPGNSPQPFEVERTVLTVPARQYFVLGDNSMNSYDSRFWGCVPAENILGRINFCYWPPKNFGPVK